MLNLTQKEAARLGLEKQSKYHNTKTEVDGIRFDSKKEAARYLELKMLERAGVITDLQLQPAFVLQGEPAPLRITYRADFMYRENGHVVVEDVKGTKTAVYKLKKKLFLAKYPEIDFRET